MEGKGGGEATLKSGNNDECPLCPHKNIFLASSLQSMRVCVCGVDLSCGLHIVKKYFVRTWYAYTLASAGFKS